MCRLRVQQKTPARSPLLRLKALHHPTMDTDLPPLALHMGTILLRGTGNSHRLQSKELCPRRGNMC